MIRFYYGSGSPFSWRVQLALEEKGLAYEPLAGGRRWRRCPAT
jgi:glutathione S-transferase